MLPCVSADLFDKRLCYFRVLATGPMTIVGVTRFGSEGKLPNASKAVYEMSLQCKLTLGAETVFSLAVENHVHAQRVRGKL